MILYLGNFEHKHTTETYIADAFESFGYEVFRVNVRASQFSKEVVASQKWDLVITYKPSELSISDFKFVKGYGPLVMWIYDIRIPISPKWLTCSMICDLVFYTNPINVNDVRNKGGNAFYLSQACDPRYHYFDPQKVEHPLVFIGRAYGERRSLIESIAKENKMTIYGPDRWIPEINYKRGLFLGDDLRKIYGKSLVTVNIAGYEHWKIDGYWSNRVWYAAACGVVVVQDYEVPRIGSIYGMENGKHIFCVNNKKLFKETVRFYCQHPEKARKLGKETSQFVVENHTYRHRVSEILQMI